MCCNEQDLKKELKHLKKVLIDINHYPNWTIEQTNGKVKNENKITRPAQVTSSNEGNEHLLMLSYKAKAGETRTKVFREICAIPTSIKYKVIYTVLKLASKYNIKHDLIYKVQCPDIYCKTTYIREVERGFPEGILDHSGCDDKSHLCEHAENAVHENVNIDHFKVLLNGYKSNEFTLHIKHERSTLNVQEKSVP